MDQRSKNKIKLFRTLKVVFYCLGLPLFLLAVILTSTSEYVGEYAYAGYADSNMFAALKVLFNGTSLYGVWIAVGVWLIIAIFHIIFTKTVANRRVRTFLVAVVTLVAMMAPVVVMDIVLPIRLEQIASAAVDGVEVRTYDDERGHYYYRSGDSGAKDGKRESYSDAFVEDVENFINVYNISLYGGLLSGNAYNADNTPVTYGELWYEGDSETAAGLVFAGTKIANDLVDEKDADGTNVLTVTYEGKTYTFTQYYSKNGDGNDARWYRKSRATVGASVNTGLEDDITTDGIYGSAHYNTNGMLTEGYVYSLEVALNILEDYYYAQEQISAMETEASLAGTTLESYNTIIANAIAAREAYYTADTSSYEYYLWTSSAVEAEGFSLTYGELCTILDALGTGLGSTQVVTNLVSFLENILDSSGTVDNCIPITLSETMTLYIFLGEYTVDGTTYGAADVLTVGIVSNGGAMQTISVDGTLLEGLADILDWLVSDVANLGYDSVTDLLNYYLNESGTISTIINLVLNLVGLDLDSLIQDADGNAPTTTLELVQNLVDNIISCLYWYNSSEILPIYDFYTSAYTEGTDAYALAELYAMQDRAIYEGGMHGYMIGSVLIPGSSILAGDQIGNGNYSSSLALTSYTAVMQLKTDLTYKTWLYPLLTARGCLLVFAPFVLLFTILSGAAAEREMLYATGQEKAYSRKQRKQMKKDEKAAAKAAKKAGKGAPQAQPTPQAQGNPFAEAEASTRAATPVTYTAPTYTAPTYTAPTYTESAATAVAPEQASAVAEEPVYTAPEEVAESAAESTEAYSYTPDVTQAEEVQESAPVTTEDTAAEVAAEEGAETPADENNDKEVL